MGTDTQRTNSALTRLFGCVAILKDKMSEVLDILKDLSPEELETIMQALKK